MQEELEICFQYKETENDKMYVGESEEFQLKQVFYTHFKTSD